VGTGVRIDVVKRLAGRPSAACAILVALSLLLGLLWMRPPNPGGDAVRYIYYALNLHDHGVFSQDAPDRNAVPRAGNDHAPLYPAWIAVFMRLSPDFRSSLACFMERGSPPASCPRAFGPFVAAQLALAGLLLGAVWLLALRLSGSASVAWLAAAAALLSRDPLRYANLVLTEALLVPLLAWFTVFLVIAYQDRQARWMLAAGAALGLAALTRPAYAYLFFASAGALAVAAAILRRRSLAAACILFIVAYGLVVAPWMARNKMQFGELALTSAYDGDILAQRVAYNRMGWAELASAFVVWFPDIGDDIGKLLLPPHFYAKLGWGEGSYYATVAPALYEHVKAYTGSAEAVMPYLLRTEVFENPVKHALVSLPLAWRAIFVSKYWGVAGLLCFVFVLIRRIRDGDRALLLASLPAWFMVAFHALVSISIPRYNLALIPLYAYAMAWTVHAAGQWLKERVRKPASRSNS
jgi:4-amino-4-deoxy-L-arabinose transferase-like glycosyltransferase